MKRHLLILCAIVLLGAANVAAQELRIIANSGVGVSAVSTEDVKGVFLLKKTSLADGSRVVPVLFTDDAAFRSFAERFCSKTTDALNTYYRGMIFSGTGSMPKSFKSEAQVIDYVSKTKGAIAFVTQGADLKGVKLLKLQ